MGQFVVHDQVAIRYADGVELLWTTWESAARVSGRLLEPAGLRDDLTGDAVAERLRRSQYRAHVAAEVGSGLIPPPSAAEAHALLIGALAACRDTLGVLAVRAELGELDEHAAEFGVQALDLTRDAFHGARSTTALVHAWVDDDAIDPRWASDAVPSGPAGRVVSIVVWALVVSCTLLLAALVVEIALLKS